jgi:hypothetical protein
LGATTIIFVVPGVLSLKIKKRVPLIFKPHR